jgi:uncharacterized Tic20 family protein
MGVSTVSHFSLFSSDSAVVATQTPQSINFQVPLTMTDLGAGARVSVLLLLLFSFLFSFRVSLHGPFPTGFSPF